MLFRHARRFEITNCDIKTTPWGRGHLPADFQHSGAPCHARRWSGGIVWRADKEVERGDQEKCSTVPGRFHVPTLREEVDSQRSQNATLETGRGRHRKYSPFVFTEQGVAMLSSVLHSPRAVQVNIAMMRAFVRMRKMLLSHEELARKVNALEGKYDAQFRVVFDAIRALMEPPKPPRRRIGF